MQPCIFENQAAGSILANSINVFDPPIHDDGGALPAKQSAMMMEPKVAPAESVRKMLYQIEINDYRSEESGQIRYN